MRRPASRTVRRTLWAVVALAVLFVISYQLIGTGGGGGGVGTVLTDTGGGVTDTGGGGVGTVLTDTGGGGVGTLTTP